MRHTIYRRAIAILVVLLVFAQMGQVALSYHRKQQEAAAALFAAHSLLKPDSVHQRGIAHRLDYPGGSDYGDTALYAHSRVVRSGSQLSAIRHGNNNAESSVIVACLRNI